MGIGYIIVGTLWAACTIGVLATGAIETEAIEDIVAAALIGLFTSAILSAPVAIIAGGLWRVKMAVMDAARRRRRRHRLGAR